MLLPFINKPPTRETAAATATAPPSVLPLPDKPFFNGTEMLLIVLNSLPAICKIPFLPNPPAFLDL